ncbi:hypothetical protein DY000_02002315 [Brassica cretica]|uniref:Uncharacterized protein n=1 Tax=Brassica cretica TaxID=69181 RepID=A0ABQ7C3C9_BRACR|nr:hypothetical protein DY000_02002316 [Brassica cretica]KAF3546666.1 hypothetical protein DY000_02002315 [Brassica cretica]
MMVRSRDTVAIHELSAVISDEATFDSCPAKLLTSEKSLSDHICGQEGGSLLVVHTLLEIREHTNETEILDKTLEQKNENTEEFQISSHEEGKMSTHSLGNLNKQLAGIAFKLHCHSSSIKLRTSTAIRRFIEEGIVGLP